MYEQYYGLRERPFDLTPDPRYLFLSPQHHEALTHLKYGLSGRPGITLLVGDAGTGKSTLVRAALQSHTSEASRIATLANPTLTRAEFYDCLSQAFRLGPDTAESKPRFLDALQRGIDASAARGGVLALIVDEAQSMPSELLEELRLLTNLEGQSGRSLTLVLVGQPELSERLNDPSMRQLKQRIALRAQLTPLSLKDTAGYIVSRITMAGGRADLIFTRDAVFAIHEASKGLPRVISVLCDNALVTGFALNTKPVGSAVVADVCADFDLPRGSVGAAQGVAPSGRASTSATSGKAGFTQSSGSTASVPAAAPAASTKPSDGRDDQQPSGESRRELFAEQADGRRFSFMRGSRR